MASADIVVFHVKQYAYSENELMVVYLCVRAAGTELKEWYSIPVAATKKQKKRRENQSQFYHGSDCLCAPFWELQDLQDVWLFKFITPSVARVLLLLFSN